MATVQNIQEIQELQALEAQEDDDVNYFLEYEDMNNVGGKKEYKINENTSNDYQYDNEQDQTNA